MIRLAATHPDWALGFEDEVWWSRLAQPTLRTWQPAGATLRVIETAIPPTDPDPKALACYGLLVRGGAVTAAEVWLRFVDGRPISAVTTQFLAWCCAKLAAAGKTALLLVWDNAGWHLSHQVRAWLRTHNQHAKRQGGVRILSCFLPSKSPWLNPIEPKWAHGKRAVVSPDRLLSAQELADRVCAYYRVPHQPHLIMPQELA